MTCDLSRARLKPFKHQIIGVEKFLEHPYFFNTDEMGAGKTKQVIDAAQVLAMQGLIDRVIVVCPAAVRAVWFDPEFGELSKHLWINMPCWVSEYHSQTRRWEWFTDDKELKIRWVVTNYDFIRKKERLIGLLKICGPKTLLVLDESSAIKNWKAEQTKACEILRARCGRIILLNGTPIANNPSDLYSQAHILSPSILSCKTFYHFRARYGILGGFHGRQIIAWQRLEDLQARMAPYVIRRLKSDCLDLPAKLDSIVLPVPLTLKTWKIYKEMRDDMVAWLNETSLSAARQAIVKAIRLSQITSGFLGGVEEQLKEDLYEDEHGFPSGSINDYNDDINGSNNDIVGGSNSDYIRKMATVEEISSEKLDLFIEWLDARLGEDPNFKLLVWCRFRPEVERLYKTLSTKSIELGKIWGGQKRQEREAALRLLDPRTMPVGPVVVMGTPASGSMGLNLVGAHNVVYLSNDYSLKTRLQSEDRVHRPGQVHAVSYFDIIATGPDGQKTIDHGIVKALKAKKDVASWTTAAWLNVLREE